MTAPTRRITLMTVVASLLAVGTVVAAERVHTVVAGESAASLAKTYYGKRDLADLLLLYNGKPGKMVHPGDRLTIPFCEVYRARPGDSWSGLAKRRFGRTGASSVLAELNGYAPGEPLRVGARIVFPVVLRHDLARGETLSSLAERFYGDAQKSATLQAFSRIDDAKRLAVGTPLEIPLVAFQRIPSAPGPGDAKTQTAAVVPPRAAAPAPAPVVPPPPADERRFAGALAAAGRRFTDGEYDGAREQLEALRERITGEGTVSDRRAWGELLAFVYIALDRDGDACVAYRSSVPPAEPMRFDPDLVSPRIRAVLSNCPVAAPSVGGLDNPAPGPQIPRHAGTSG